MTDSDMKPGITLVFDDVTLARGTTFFFKHLNLVIAEGEHWLITGNNGTGKTKLLEAIAGTLTPRAGSIRYSFIDGEDWDTRYQQRRALIHFMRTEWLQRALAGSGEHFYQERYYSLSGVSAPLVRDALGESLDAIQALNLPAAFDITHLLDVEVTRLSNGQLRKVIILQQLGRGVPRLLLLDYPYDGLDAGSRKDLNEFLDHVAHHLGVQIIMVAHGTEVPRCINKYLIVEDNKITIAAAPPLREPIISTYSQSIASENNTPIVEMRNLKIAYGERTILSDFNWRVCRGERWALTGKNGTGKTTIFSLIYADHPMAYSQQVFLFGKRRGSGESIWDIKKRVQYFGPEQVHFLNTDYMAVSAREFITQAHQGKGHELDDLIMYFDADKYIDKPVRYLSSGHLQMVMLIRLFLDRKELILLDEPFQYLDPQNRDRVTEYLMHFLSPETTLILISHDERDLQRWTKHKMELRG